MTRYKDENNFYDLRRVLYIIYLVNRTKSAFTELVII
jgi:hypothetical protein